jgi:hypothetical protein
VFREQFVKNSIFEIRTFLKTTQFEDYKKWEPQPVLMIFKNNDHLHRKIENISRKADWKSYET